MPTDTEELVYRLRNARTIVVLTGSGVSAASGIPTFRGDDGLWRTFRAEELATPEAFAHDPKTVWEWYDWRRTKIAASQPNAAHTVLAKWSQRPGFTLITQNVDGLHERAGTQNVTRFHGSLFTLACRARCPESAPEGWEHDGAFSDWPPRCPHCGGLARPGVVWFGEPIPAEALRAAAQAVNCDVFLTVGTSAVVYPAAGLLLEAAARGAFTVEINPDATPATRGVDLALAGAAEDVLDRVERILPGE